MDAFDETIKNFFGENTNKESRKFTLIMVTKFMPTEAKKQMLKDGIDHCGEKEIDKLFDLITDAISSDEFAENMREHYSKS